MNGDRAPEKGSSAGSFPPRMWVALILLVVAVVFVAQNRDATEIQILFFAVEAPLWAVLTGAVALGLVIGLLLLPSRGGKDRKAPKR
ncbi:uncharacterized protein DUF1049 [Murinocardiopsis flavida]|uniref:Uncharacterized protein DUF1049 n=1 Tax=Murinocardiopsis flavida TaxID=645275 RepID=A0A2P8CPQ8_9ACTN|nr:lipopolysaccharide assembly protein LapA domain-containing protein [Murinocardiopsis flavida]PSK86932.1 uncharacterized protein DUF1049 [Murinocardiopsis flavida]